MKSRQRREIRALQRAVEELLFAEWDPIGINEFSQCRDEYDSYAATLARLLWDGVDEYKLVELLGRFQTDAMGLSSADDERDRRVAQRMLALVIDER